MAEPSIKYAKTSDGVSIGYTILGAGVPLVFTTNIWGDVNWYSHDGSARRTIDAIVDLGCQVLRYDGRGMGDQLTKDGEYALNRRRFGAMLSNDSCALDDSQF